MQRFHEWRLTKHKLLIEDETARPYFSIIDTTSLAIDKLYVEDWHSQEEFYEKKFSKKDSGIIKYYLGGLKAFELGNLFSLKSINHDSDTITVINKNTLETEVWNIPHIINTQQYLQLDKNSLFQVACFYEGKKDVINNKSVVENISNEDGINNKKVTILTLIK